MHRRHAAASLVVFMVACAFAAAVGAQQKPEAAQPAAATTPAQAAGTYEIDPVHSSVIFRINHMGVSEFIGRFNDISGTIVLDPVDYKRSAVAVTIKTDSIDTNNKARDAHLKGPEFFDAEKFPTMTFVATAPKFSNSKIRAGGVFSLHGVDNSITVDLIKVGERDAGERFGHRAGWTADFIIKRSAFGIDYGVEEGSLGDDVHITICIEAIKTK